MSVFSFTGHFEPKLLQRLTVIVVFNPLCHDQSKDVTSYHTKSGEPEKILKKPKIQEKESAPESEKNE